jgi:hypothetical protein
MHEVTTSPSRQDLIEVGIKKDLRCGGPHALIVFLHGRSFAIG